MNDAHERETIVRMAEIKDEPALFDFLVTLHRDGLGRHFPYDFGKVQAAIEHGTRQRGGVIGIVDAPDRPGYIAGSVGLLLDEWWWSRCAFLQLKWVYVRREYRHGTHYGAELRRFAEGVREHFHERRPSGSPPVVLETSFVGGDSQQQVELKDRLFARWGRRVGSVYISGL